MKKRISIVLAGLVACSTLAFGACGGTQQDVIILTDENKNKVKYAVAKTWDYAPAVTKYVDNFGPDVMPILGFWGPYKENYYQGSYIPSLQTPEMYADIAESGVNLVMQNNDRYDEDPETVNAQLKMCEDAGLGYIVTDFSLANVQADSSDFYGKDATTYEKDQAVWNAKVAAWNEYESFAGYYIKDEPPSVTVKAIGPITERINEAYKANNIESKINFTNAFPYGYIVSREGRYSYAEHLRLWAEEAKVDYFCYDLYPFQYEGTDNLNGGFYLNLAEVYNASKTYSIPWWSCVQAGGNWVGNTVDLHTGVMWPTHEQLLWEVNMFVAHGAKGLCYFTLNIPHSYYQYIQYDGGSGLFDVYGNRTYLFYAAQQANAQVLAVDHILMHATNHGVILKGALPGGARLSAAEIKNDKFRELTSVSEDSTALVGCFDYYGKTALYVVNSSYYEDTEVKLTFDDRYCYDVTQRAELVSAVGKKITLKLDAGEAAMIALR